MLTKLVSDLMQMPIEKIKALPPSSSHETVDDKGRRIQIVTWCDRQADDKYRVVVSSHHMRWLGASSVVAAEGFIIDETGNVEKVDNSVVLALLE